MSDCLVGSAASSLMSTPTWKRRELGVGGDDERPHLGVAAEPRGSCRRARTTRATGQRVHRRVVDDDLRDVVAHLGPDHAISRSRRFAPGRFCVYDAVSDTFQRTATVNTAKRTAMTTNLGAVLPPQQPCHRTLSTSSIGPCEFRPRYASMISSRSRSSTLPRPGSTTGTVRASHNQAHLACSPRAE